MPRIFMRSTAHQAVIVVQVLCCIMALPLCCPFLGSEEKSLLGDTLNPYLMSAMPSYWVAFLLCIGSKR
ncbi:hypothetical protein EJ03DRAFT_200578 [Teratosphaeria nubilosa]|uniref:Uncharacterized protein n=1 Tax=Teratosphaeria nubilosa TaxID=161662 RepID=A0A6G1LHD1_9PEZI|nr:hypothetical protein EJ03DRAFT_200578 [Teratosphaeria nubilosa]